MHSFTPHLINYQMNKQSQMLVVTGGALHKHSFPYASYQQSHLALNSPSLNRMPYATEITDFAV